MSDLPPDSSPIPAPRVSVIVVHFSDPVRLAWVLAALERQDEVPGGFEVIVADDGSPVAPHLPDTPFPLVLVTQADLGFRAASARNLGATAARGEVLVFLDGDTVPEPAYVSTLAAAVASADEGCGVLAVGRRRYADFTGRSSAEVMRWVAGRRERPADGTVAAESGAIPELPEPTWLRDGYARTDDLRAAGSEDFRLVISAVMACDSRLFQRTRGFDASIVGYGGEDWDLAFRAYLAGAQLRHVPGAIAWHDGQDAGGRDISITAKNTETLALAERIPLASTRGRGLVYELPHIVVRLDIDNGAVARGAEHGNEAVDPGTSEAKLVVLVDGLLRGTDAAVFLADDVIPQFLQHDPRIRSGAPPERVLERASWVVEVFATFTLDRTLMRLCREVGEVFVPGILRIRSTRALAQGDRAPAGEKRRPEWCTLLENEPLLERLWGHW